MKVHFIGTREALAKYGVVQDIVWRSARDVESFVLDPVHYESQGWWARRLTKSVLRDMRKGLTDHDMMVIVDDGVSPLIPHWIIAFLAGGVYRLSVPDRFKPAYGYDGCDGVNYYKKFESLEDLFELWRGTTWALDKFATRIYPR